VYGNRLEIDSTHTDSRCLLVISVFFLYLVYTSMNEWTFGYTKTF